MPYAIPAPPYFDDFDETKNYQSILFKPSLPVQTRELNQTQTILQSQIERFGNSIYKNGSVVTGGEIHVNEKVLSLKLVDNYNGAINVTPLLNLFAKGRTTGLIAKILFTIPKTSTDPNTLVYQSINIGTNAGLFLASEIIDIYNDQDCTSPFNVTVKANLDVVTNLTGSTTNGSDHLVMSSVTGIAVGDRVIHSLIRPGTYVSQIVGNNVYVDSPINFDITSASFTFSRDVCAPTMLVNINKGVYFVDGYFLNVNPQTIILDKYTRYSSYIVGLSHSYNIVTSDDDASLLDNSSGSTNYAGPGADRLQIPLILDKKPLIDNTPANLVQADFFEILRVSQGAVLSQNAVPQYSELQKTLSRRTYEEAGNFLVRPFVLNLTDDPRFQSAVLAKISSGKAYVRGNEIEKISETQLRIDRSRATESVTSYDISTYHGSYVKVSSLTKSLPQISSGLTVELHNVTTGFSAGSKIGTANVSYLAYDSGSGSGIVYKAYLFNISLSGATAFTATKALITTAVAGNYSNITTSMLIDAIGMSSGNTVLFDSSYNSLVFDIPQTYISTVPTVRYTTRRVFKNVNFSSGVATITGNTGTEQFLGGSGTISSAVAIQYYGVIATSTSGTFTAGQFITLDTNSRTVTIPVVGAGVPGQCTIDVKDATFNGTCDIIATLYLSNDTRRTKSLVTGAQKQFASPTATMSLLKSDVARISGIYDSGNIANPATTSSTNITANYTFDNGQRDTHYDHGTITLNAGASAPVGQVLVVFDYYTHSGGTGYFTVDSYAVGYDNIPSYKDSTGVTHQLRDCLDFRPRRTDDSATVLFNTFQLPDATFATIDESYYLSRIDKVILSPDGQLKVLTGISAYKNPQPPADLPDAMTLYTLIFPAYTQYASSVKIIYENNRRYTMKDIAKLDRRLSNVEYYTSLSSLEQSVVDRTITNSSGTTLFKNGFLTDNFSDFTIADTGSAEFKCSIDTVRKFVRAPYKIDNATLTWNTTGTTAQKTGSLVTMPYTEKAYITQNLATKAINVNPYNVLSNIGVLNLTPSSDVWYDTNSLPVITVNNDNNAAFAQAQAQANAINQNASWGAWQTNWVGTTTSSTGTTTQTSLVRFQTIADVSSSTVTSADTVVVSKEQIPYMRSIYIQAEVVGLVPFSQVFAWMDGINISKYVTPSSVSAGFTGIASITTNNGGTGYTSAPTVNLVGGDGTGAAAVAQLLPNGSVKVVITTYGSGYTVAPTVQFVGGGGSGAVATVSLTQPEEGMPLWTDKNGRFVGTIRVPNDSMTKFASGSKKIVFNDTMNSASMATSYAFNQFLSQGYINNTQTTITSTRVPVVTTTELSDSTTTSVFTPKSEPVVTTDPAVTQVATTVQKLPDATKSPLILTVVDNTTPKTDTIVANPNGSSATKRDFLDSTQSKSDVASKIAANTGASYATAFDMLNNVCAAYTTFASAMPERTIGTQTGLPDVNGAEYWAIQALKNGQSTAQASSTLASVLQSAVATGYDNSAFKNKNADGTIGTCVLDPVAETFFIDENRNPNGVFLSSVDLFFATKDLSNPVMIEIRPTVNGYPSANTVVPFSQVTMLPSAVNTSTDGTVATNCKFPSPVFLQPGEYALVIKANTNQYTVYVAEMGKILLGQNKSVTAQPYIGSLFQSQNASTWTASQEMDLCFVLYKCEFAIGTNKFYLNGTTPSSQFNFDLVNVTGQHLSFGALTDLQMKIATTALGGSLSSYISVLPNVDKQLSSRQQHATNSDLMMEYTLSSSSYDVSPVVDLERASVIMVQNIINQVSDWTVDEVNPTTGSAAAKYLSKKVVLAQGFDATNLVTYLDINRPAGTAVKVYYRVKNVFDSTDIVNRPWVLMTQEVNGGYTSQDGVYVEDKWSAYGISYTSGGTTYSNFRTYQIKVVFVSSNPSLSAQVKDIREIALA